MNIACSTDDNYVRYCGVMLTSLFENNKEEVIHIYVFTEGLSRNNRMSLENIVNHYKGFFHYCKIESDLIKEFPLKEGSYISIATYYRLLIPQILPTDLNKVIYLDCDIIVSSNLNKLWNVDLTNYALGAVDESTTLDNGVFARLQYSSEYGYYNAGVLLFNLNYWRNNNIINQCFTYIKENPEKIVLADQDVLNAVLHAQCLHLPCKWNVGTAFYTVSYVRKYRSDTSLIQALKSPYIIHFTWEAKPWTGFEHPMRRYFFKYQKLTEWKKMKLSFYISVKLMIKEILFFFGLRKNIFVNPNQL